MTGRERILAMYEGRPVDRLPLMPITMMFAGDWLQVKYREYVTDYRVLAESQVKVARDFNFDCVSVISDPAREASDLGAAIKWFENQPPAIVEGQALLADKTTLARLKVLDPLTGKRMLDRVRGVALLNERASQEKMVEGWVEGPCALAADLRGLNTLMLDFFDDSGFVAHLFEFVVELELRFACAQIEAGADLIGVGDAAASLIGPRFYDQLVVPYEQKLIEGLHAMGTRVRLHICGNTRKLFRGMAKLEAEHVDLDWMAPIGKAREQMGPSQVLAGNIDPVRVLREGTPESITAALEECFCQARNRYIVAAGCEVPRGTPEPNLCAMTRFAETHAPVQV
jgi:MtaA/CmuA family methyltransferase